MQNTFSNVCFVWIVNPILTSIVPNQPSEKVTDLMNVNICTLLRCYLSCTGSREVVISYQSSSDLSNLSWPPNRVGLAVPGDAATMAKAASAPSRETTLPSIAPVFLRVFIIFAPSLPNLRAMAWSWASDSSLEWSAGSEIPWSKLSWPFTSNTTKILNQSVIKPNHLILVNRLRGEKK